MRIKFMKSLWGMTEGETTAAKFRMIREAGYDGVEWMPPESGFAEWKALLADHGLDYCALVGMAEVGHIRPTIERCVEAGASAVVCHSGRDRMTFEQGCAFLREALAVEKDLGIPIAHETHRHRLFYCPWSTAAYLREFPELRINADFSHWCVVCESLLDDMEDFLEIAIARAAYIHGRVGHAEGPQVNDPRAPEWAPALAAHEAWWDRIVAARRADGMETLYFTPEFGPPDYLQTLPHTRQPVADLWQVCLWMAERQRKRLSQG